MYKKTKQHYIQLYYIDLMNGTLYTKKEMFLALTNVLYNFWAQIKIVVVV